MCKTRPKKATARHAPSLLRHAPRVLYLPVLPLRPVRLTLLLCDEYSYPQRTPTAETKLGASAHGVIGETTHTSHEGEVCIYIHIYFELHGSWLIYT